MSISWASSRLTTRAVATLPGGATEGFYCMTPALYAYPDDPPPRGAGISPKRYKARYGRDPKLPRRGRLHRPRKMVLIGLEKAPARTLTVDSFIKGMGKHPRL